MHIMSPEHDNINDIPSTLAPIMPNAALSPNALTVPSADGMKSLRTRRSFCVTIEGPDTIISGTHVLTPEGHHYPTHFPNISKEYGIPNLNQKWWDYDLELNISSKHNGAVGVVAPPETFYGLEGKIREGDMVVMNGDRRKVWLVGSMETLPGAEVFVSYKMRDLDTADILYLHVPFVWSQKACHLAYP